MKQPTAIATGTFFALLALASLPAAPQPADPSVKKSPAGYCYSKGDKHYDRLTKFTPYATLEACLESGGRLRRVVDH